jgi:ATP-dependent Lon protease
MGLGDFMFPFMPLSLKPKEKLETGLMLPLRNIVLLPGITLPIVAGRSRSVAVAESVMVSEKKQLIIASVLPEAFPRLEQNDKAEIESLEELYPIATLTGASHFGKYTGRGGFYIRE